MLIVYNYACVNRIITILYNYSFVNSTRVNLVFCVYYSYVNAYCLL